MESSRATKSSSDPGSYRNPVFPASTSSGMPVIAGARTIFPRAIASISTSGSPSLRLVSTTTSARSYSDAICCRSTCPSSVTRVLESTLADQRFQMPSLRALARNRAFKFHPALVKLGAGPHQKRVIFHRMQPPHGQHRESGPGGLGLEKVTALASTPSRDTTNFSASTPG